MLTHVVDVAVAVRVQVPLDGSRETVAVHDVAVLRRRYERPEVRAQRQVEGPLQLAAQV